MFKHAIVRKPSINLSAGLTSANYGKPDYTQACQQHKGYIQALQACGVEVHVLQAEPEYPDACFVEDTAVLTENVAIITNLGAPSRQGEQRSIAIALRNFYRDDQIETIIAPGTLEGGDVMRVGDHFYVGLSARTNQEGFRQFTRILKKHDYTASLVELKEMLHLKTGVAYLENNVLLTAGEFIGSPQFASFNTLPIEPTEAYAANCIYVNGTVLTPAGYPTIRAKIEALGLPTLQVDTSEFRKLDGGLSCLSLRF